MIIIKEDKLKNTLKEKLLNNGFNNEDADLCSWIFTENTLCGVASHGIERFPLFIEMIEQGHIKPDVKPLLVNSFGACEQWDGNYGAGPLNAWFITERAIELAKMSGIGCATLKNTNHWMRAGTFGWKAAQQGFVLICWTNTFPNLPPWGAKESRTGNNPIVFAIPRKNKPVILDIALSQFSYGKLATLERQNELLPLHGGYNKDDKLTNDPAEIIESQRPLPIGYWKGSGLSLLLDLIAAILSGGKATKDIVPGIDTGMSQVFIAIDPSKFNSMEIVEQTVDEIIEFYKGAEKSSENDILYPGERALKTKLQYQRDGIPVDEEIWEKVLSL